MSTPSEIQGLVEAIRERPDDDLPRLALADWCMEQPDPVSHARGEFIQLRCRAAALRPDDPARYPLERRSRELRERYERDWLGGLAEKIGRWDFERGLVVVVVHPESIRRLARSRPADRPEWFWVVGAKGVLLDPSDIGRLMRSHLPGLLTQFDLSDCDVRSAGVEAVANNAELSRLACLRLGYGQIGDRGAEELAKSPHLGRLAELTLSNCTIGKAGAQALRGWPATNRLAHLDLSYNPLGAEGGRLIATCPALGNLATLGLAGCQLGDRVGWLLAESRGLASVETLDLRDNGLGQEVRAALEARFGRRVLL